MLRALFRQLDPEDMGTVGLPLLLECLCEHSPDQGAKTSAVGGEGGRAVLAELRLPIAPQPPRLRAQRESMRRRDARAAGAPT